MKHILNKDMLYRLFYSFLIGCLGAGIGIALSLSAEWVLNILFDVNVDLKPFVYMCFGAGFILMFVTYKSNDS
jgi:hypothetical protein